MHSRQSLESRLVPRSLRDCGRNIFRLAESVREKGAQPMIDLSSHFAAAAFVVSQRDFRGRAERMTDPHTSRMFDNVAAVASPRAKIGGEAVAG
jgi:hypothetical protein